jgi:hypothetical protein
MWILEYIYIYLVDIILLGAKEIWIDDTAKISKTINLVVASILVTGLGLSFP